MNTIDVLCAVDALGAASTGSLVGNVYLVDTNAFIGSWQEGTADLVTVCQDGQHVQWSATAVSPESQIGITEFSGTLVDQRICVPVQGGDSSAPSWLGLVESPSEVGMWSYTVTLEVDGRPLQFLAFLKVV